MIVQEIKKVLEEGVSKKHFPGAHFSVIYKNQKPLNDYVGYKRIYPELEPLKGNEIYDIASLTKVVSTTTLIMKLIEDGRLTLDTNVSDVLTWFHIKDITVYDLLTHTSGLPADIPRAYKLKDKQDVLSNIKNVKIIYKKHEHVCYSDIGYILLGLMIEEITKKSLNENGCEFIFKPLGMHDTSYYPDKKRCAPTEYRDDEVFKGVLQGKVHDEKAFALGEAGHAGLFSTVHDLSLFIKTILEDRFVLKKETLDMLFKVREEHPSLKGSLLKRALGWDKPTAGSSAGDYVDFDETILHTGFTGCNMFIDRKNGIGFVMLSNAVHPKRELNQIIGYRNRLSNMIYKKSGGK
jgi:CubicO group peptidase (beta-lactamase class C family)